MSAVPLESVSEAVVRNKISLPGLISDVLEIEENVGIWLTAKGEPESPDPCEEAEHIEAALWSQTKPYQILLSESTAKVV